MPSHLRYPWELRLSINCHALWVSFMISTYHLQVDTLIAFVFVGATCQVSVQITDKVSLFVVRPIVPHDPHLDISMPRCFFDEVSG